MLNIGLDIGSTTIKSAVINEDGELVYSSYERHFSEIPPKATALIYKIKEKFNLTDNDEVKLCISGSAGMGFAEDAGFPFVQEVYATRTAVLKYAPKTDTVI